jgi:6-phosphogluconolactonase (cycloisomerase 2 family)
VCEKFLFASNDYSGNISGFAINPLTGHLKAVPGSPFTIDGTDSEGIPLAITTDCKFVFAGDLNSNLIFAFHVSANGKLVPVKGSPFSVPDEPGVLKLSPHDRFLAVTFNSLQAVGMYRVSSGGVLTAVPGSPFSASPESEGLGATDIDCSTSFLYLPESVDKIDIFSIASNGALTLTTGSPFVSPSGNDVAVLSPNGRFLLTRNESAGVNSFQVLSGGNIENVPGSPFDADLSSSGGVSINKAGTLLFVSDFGSIYAQFSAMKVGRKGSLTLSPGSPISTSQDGGMFSLAAYPSKTCAARGSLDSSAKN